MEFQAIWQFSSERTLVLFLDGKISLDKQKLCWSLAEYLKENPIVVETVVGMNALTLYLDISTIKSAKCLNTQREILQALTDEFIANFNPVSNTQSSGKHVKIPVIYGGEFGVDLTDSAKRLGMSVIELVERHSAPIYTVYFIGFQAGFPYLGGLPDELHLPRHTKPRTNVPAGSVGIGGAQTGIYPFSSPGGWQLLGRTQLPLFDKANTPPTLLQAGDTLQFVVQDILE